jgi:hypothetical protein
MVDTKQSVLNTLLAHFTVDGQPKVNDDLSVNAPEDVVLHNQFYSAFEKLPVGFSHVGGGLMLSINKLKTLQGCPTAVGGSFECDNNSLQSLEFGPSQVGESYNCSHNQLKNLIGAPKIVPMSFNCSNNPLETLEGFPEKIGKTVYITYTPSLPLLRTLVAREIIFWPSTTDNGLKVLSILAKHVGQGRRGAFSCKKELIEAGFEENARW